MKINYSDNMKLKRFPLLRKLTLTAIRIDPNFLITQIKDSNNENSVISNIVIETKMRMESFHRQIISDMIGNVEFIETGIDNNDLLNLIIDRHNSNESLMGIYNFLRSDNS